jgi:hypothetical protein
MYRLIFEEGYDSLEGYEKALSQSTGKSNGKNGSLKSMSSVVWKSEANHNLKND